MNYIAEAIKTESINFSVESSRLLHAAIGVSTEVAEILLATDEINLREEIGDVCWYLAVACDEFGIDFDELALLGDAEDGDTPERILRGAADALDYMKKCCFYGKDLDHAVLARHFATVYRGLAEQMGDEMEQILQTNIDKLRARYGEKFTTGAAEVRDLDKERAILEGVSRSQG